MFCEKIDLHDLLLKMLFEHLGLFRLFSIQFLFLVLYVIHFTATCILFTKKKKIYAKELCKGRIHKHSHERPFFINGVQFYILLYAKNYPQ